MSTTIFFRRQKTDEEKMENVNKKWYTLLYIIFTCTLHSEISAT